MNPVYSRIADYHEATSLLLLIHKDAQKVHNFSDLSIFGLHQHLECCKLGSAALEQVSRSPLARGGGVFLRELL